MPPCRPPSGNPGGRNINTQKVCFGNCLGWLEAGKMIRPMAFQDSSNPKREVTGVLPPAASLLCEFCSWVTAAMKGCWAMWLPGLCCMRGCWWGLCSCWENWTGCRAARLPATLLMTGTLCAWEVLRPVGAREEDQGWLQWQGGWVDGISEWHEKWLYRPGNLRFGEIHLFAPLPWCVVGWRQALNQSDWSLNISKGYPVTFQT